MAKIKNLIKDQRGIFGLNAVQSFFAIVLGIALLAYIIVIVMGILGGTTILAAQTSTCYQETTNATNSADTSGCYLNYGGSYVFTSITNTEKGYDGNYSTAIGISGDNGLINFTYKKPTNFVGVKWQLEDEGGISNITINSSCLTYSATDIKLSWETHDVSGPDYVRCYNGTEWLVMDIRPGNLILFNEEAMYWTSQKDTIYQSQLTQILGNTSTGVTGFFSAINPVYAILAILVIILVLVVLVRVVAPQNGSSVQL